MARLTRRGRIVEGAHILELRSRTNIHKPVYRKGKIVGAVDTNRRTGVRTVSEVGPDGILKAVKKLPPLKKKGKGKARLSKG